MMPRIYFSSDYEKLPTVWEGTQATLMATALISITELKDRNPAFIRYDTKYRGKEGVYPLNFEQGILLFFLHLNTGRPFTTIRKNWPTSEKRYNEQIGKTFVLAKSRESP